MIEKNKISKGLIVKALSGFYYVDTGNEVIECRARGKFKKDKFNPLVGDLVEISQENSSGVIISIEKRKNAFKRPPVANVGQFIVVNSLKDPEPNFSVIDKFLVNAEAHNVPAVLCFNKMDLVSETDIKKVRQVYEGIYPIIFIQASTSKGMRDLLPWLKGKNSALVGPSGVGKSTLINAIRCEFLATTGNISEKNRRGKNTTRHVESFCVEGGGRILDTPGFTSFDISEIDEEDLQYMFPEMEYYIGKCKFTGCRHLKEPDCQVRKAVARGEIHKNRYDSYICQIENIRERYKNKY